MVPQRTPVRSFIQFGNTHSILIRRDMLCSDIHSDLAEIQVGPDSGRGCDPGQIQYVQYHCPGQFPGSHPVSAQIGCDIDKHFVNGIDVDVLRGNVFQINFVDPAADLHITRHLRRSGHIGKFQRRVGPQFRILAGRTAEPASRSLLKPQRIHFLYFLHDFKQPCPAGDPVCFQGWRYGQADGLLRAASVRHHQIGSHRIQTAVHTLHRGIK